MNNFVYSETIKTAPSCFTFNNKAIADVFVIDCINRMTQGDLILFSEDVNYTTAGYRNTNREQKRK